MRVLWASSLVGAIACTPVESGLEPTREGATTPATEGVLGRFVLVSPGVFLMGSSEDEAGRLPWETRHEVRVDRAFLLKQTEVTQGQWRALMGTNPSGFAGCETCPVEQVSWWDAAAWCNAASALEGLEPCYDLRACSGLPGGRDERTLDATHQCGEVIVRDQECDGYRLPTEAEWEYAARAGSAAARHGDPEAIAWFEGNAGPSTHPVATRAPNELGLFDMLGNVAEWTDTPFDEVAASWFGHPADGRRAVRGGHFGSPPSELRAASRSGLGAYRTYFTVGFRPARSVRR